MIILQIEHPVPNYDGWKKAFDSDPMERARSGVKSYRITSPVDNKNYVLIELSFEEREKAESMLERLKELWKQVEGKVMMNPQARIIEVLETKNY